MYIFGSSMLTLQGHYKIREKIFKEEAGGGGSLLLL
jgi:hypothetical protein